MENQDGIKWPTIIWAALLMFILPMLVIFLVPTIVGVYVGFSTQGDMAQVNAAVQSVGTSLVYQIVVYVLFALVALWRGYVLAKKVAGQLLLQLGIAVLLTVLLVAAYFMIGSAGNLAAVWDEILIIAVMVLGGAYLGSLLKPSQAATV